MNLSDTKLVYKIYILKENETLEIVAAKFGLQINAIRTFHNKHASLTNRIPYAGAIPSYVLELFLPYAVTNKGNENLHITKEKPIQLASQNHLLCDFTVLNHRYGVVINLVTKKEKKRFHYTTGIECTDEFEYVYDLVLSKSNVYLDYKEPNMLAENLAEALGKPLYPIAVKAYRSGQFSGVFNQPEVFKRWQKVKAKTQRYFKSPIAAQQIKNVDSAYKNRIAIEKAIKRDFFFKLYFSGLYNVYFSKLEIKNTIKVPLYPFIDGIQYQIKQSINPYLNANNNIVVYQKGTVSDLRSSKDIEENKDTPYYKSTPLEGELDITYELCNTTHVIKSIVGSITLLVNKKLDKKITIEAYHLT
ncbi:hypothetical protein CXF68_02765 [Tenacibaculum sp. Bg11-29]|uniref:hypothetical protein n=1 Tax=Tenacibaculum sp. Bg11-29 TaxID=2058306 RepID=UPI000C32CE54|nr:hypothetical protein [Tenacibaculum sp. Bg11-29]PKH49680.1 hypothetical protein CXF68_02765 [Tenacibaculum sp. Bg11-29]